MNDQIKVNSQDPIGIFDSGIGGINIFNAIKQLLPKESLFYYADTKHCPYGSKTKEQIIKYSEIATEYLLNRNCKLIVVACNTATGAAITHLRKKYDIEFVGIEPATKPAAEYSKTGNVGILATEHTFQTDHFINTKNKHAHKVNIHIQPGIGLVEQIESNQILHPKTTELLQKYLNPLIEKNIDSLVLGCTHYPFLISEMRKILPPDIKIFDPSPAVAQQVKLILEKHNLTNDGNAKSHYYFFTSGDNSIFSHILKNLLNFDYSVIDEIST